MLISQFRLVLKVIKKHLLLIIVLFLISLFIFLTIFKNFQKIDDDAEDVNIDFLKDKLFKLQRSHFLNEPINNQDDVNINSLELTQDGTLDHNKILSNQTIKNIDLIRNHQNCRNSVQGKLLIVDEKGYVCERNQLNTGGCCDFNKFSLERFSCKTCSSNNCCSVYEYCISCCLDSNKKTLLQKVLTQQSILLNKGLNRGIQALFASVTDHFELCLAKCRTSSQSVQHENSYKNPLKKYCFGLYKEEDKNKLKKNVFI